jgi:aspartyl-tRNA(Asn)/glutamyl-tRNA(Gln) amidotransferase subunit C
MKISREEVLHVAKLARVGLTEEEVGRFTEQLSHILENFEVLKQLDTTGVTPTTQSIPLKNVMKDDEVKPSIPTKYVLANAPGTEDDYFRIRAVLE